MIVNKKYNKFTVLPSHTDYSSDLIAHYKKNSDLNILHRDDDIPSLICLNGSSYWYKNNNLHRENDLPAYINSDGTKKWYKNGKLHRDNDKPAIIYYDDCFMGCYNPFN